ncbi:hypothetical protein HX109_10995 [Galbibacter sp. BG1]|uniref:tail fiber protein n=1 Tax=Galbibacter sp. BG1 TaxID=1170699 RepID=UPI0015BC0F7A|nr:tail fiber protein [Galbibacter sp. BG1]QLE02055.1 hypothetical protein HX109_10995 [Galbibacter sp. BG1]
MKPYVLILFLVYFYSSYSQYSFNGSNQHTFQTTYGTVDIGPFNADWAHIYTDRPKIIFNKDVYTATNAFSSYNNDLILKTNGTERLRISNVNGNVGFGVTNPLQRISVDGNVLSNGFILTDTELGSNSDYIAFFREDIQTDHSVLKLQLGDDNVSEFNIGFKSWSTQQWHSTMLIKANGNVGIGTIAPDSKLTVNGNIHTKEVKVDLNGALAPDYVFKKEYDLKSPKEVQAYIKKEGHLPNIPSAAQMEKEGLNLKEMNLKLLEKIEELTLYIIDQDERIRVLEKQNKTSQY